MNRIALKSLALVVVSVGALTAAAPAAEANHSSGTYTGKSATGADVTLKVNGSSVDFSVAQDGCGQAGSGQAMIDERHWFGGRATSLLMGGLFSGPDTAQGWYQFLGCPPVNWTAGKQQLCDCEDTRVFATWINVGGSFSTWDMRWVKLHLVVDCVEGLGADCSGSATASVSGATAVPADIRLSCVARDKCPESMKATKNVKIRRGYSRTGPVTITIKHGCANGPEETTTLTIQYTNRGKPVRGASDLNGDGKPDRIS